MTARRWRLLRFFIVYLEPALASSLISSIAVASVSQGQVLRGILIVAIGIPAELAASAVVLSWVWRHRPIEARR